MLVIKGLSLKLAATLRWVHSIHLGLFHVEAAIKCTNPEADLSYNLDQLHDLLGHSLCIYKMRINLPTLEGCGKD